MRRAIDPRNAFGMVELIAVFMILCLLVAIMIPANLKAKDKARRISCVGRLKNIGLGYRMFATDHKDRFPWELETNDLTAMKFEDVLKHYLIVSNEVFTPKLFVCPADARTQAADWAGLTRQNVSYFIGLNPTENFPQSVFAGDRNLMTNGVPLGPGIVTLQTNTNISWSGRIHKFQGNAAMADGSVQKLSSARLRQQLDKTGLSGTRVAIP